MITIDSKIKEVFEELELSYALQNDELEVSAYSPEGQDCSVGFPADLMENTLRSMAEWVSDYDVDAEAALWIGDDVRADIESLNPTPGTPDAPRYILLCSDGLCGVVRDEEMARIVRADGDLKSKTEALVAAANAAGGPDNITVVLVEL